MFCPNCGTQNDSAATPCKKCGFKLSGVSIPKFKGTMMLNSDQTVQNLIDEHHRKQAPGTAQNKGQVRASQPAPARPPSAPPPQMGSSQRGAVLQPPRAAGGSSKRRMGGTMLGVAPQGGVLPPQVPPAAQLPPVPPPEPPRDEPAPSASSAGASASELPGEGPADPLAGTYAMPTSEPPAETLEPRADGPALRATQPLEATDSVPPAREAGRGRPLAATAALPVSPEPGSAEPGSAEPSDRGGHSPRLRAVDIVLLVCTLGLYGFVLRARRKRASAPSQPPA